MGSSSYPSSLKRSPPPKIFTAHQDLTASLEVAIEMIKSLGHLQSLRLPLQWFVPAVINELVYHDELSYLGITTPAGECFEMQGPENDIFSITMPKQGGIPSLTELNLAVGISGVAKSPVYVLRIHTTPQ
ncbi:hypothetical protein PLEOSDRAFT_154346 [Pleurotus ostreatus PC15]|uniref:Uncharacterized protein n=1 Tax=Pleurotus ostreatus (strain PC15) TaxID=1137138 RepID=A0A067NVP3_PLEO1|nr:hypothetical protein PLEOSDRAFT_154346 [Pleurotus ostreatus PC15]